MAYYYFSFPSESLVIGTFVKHISVILLEKIWKDLSTLPSETFRIWSQFAFSKSVIIFLEHA